MADAKRRVASNADGDFFVDSSCINCGVSRDYAPKTFGADRVIHEFERAAQPDAEIILDGEGDHDVGSARIFFTPGHTKGHMVLLWRGKYLYVGDHFASRAFCWHSWGAQIESTGKLEVLTGVKWVFPGHGKWFQIPPGGFPKVIRQRVRKMVAER